MTFPPGTNLPNTAGIPTYGVTSNPGKTATFFPASNIDATVSTFGGQVPMKRPRQPAERATADVVLADPPSSTISGATRAVAGGEPFL